jgi:aminoglycoside phosphotransferase (APT) family kinase protein
MPFFVMTKAEGRVPLNGTPSYHATGWVHDLPVDEQRRLYRNALAVWVKIHEADWERDFSFLNRPEHGAPGIDQQIGYIEASYDWARRGRTFSVVERGLEYATSNRPAVDGVAVCWGDCRVGNMVFAPDQSVAAVLDWEMATLGPRELDVAWWMMFERLFGTLMAPAPLPGIGSADEVPALYEELSGYTPRHLDYFETFAWLRLAVCMIRMEAPDADDDAEAFVAKDPVMHGLAARLG